MFYNVYKEKKFTIEMGVKRPVSLVIQYYTYTTHNTSNFSRNPE